MRGETIYTDIDMDSRLVNYMDVNSRLVNLAVILVLSFNSCAASGKHCRSCVTGIEWNRRCKISVPTTDEPIECQNARNNSVSRNRQFYKLTVAGKTSETKFPFASTIPFLDQTIYSVFYHPAQDPIDSKLLNLLEGFDREIKTESSNYLKMLEFDDTDHYKQTYNSHNELVNNMRAPNYFSNPANHSTFTDIIQNQRWKEDAVFTQQRLAGPCPFLIRLVTVEGETGMKSSLLIKLLNRTFQ